MNAAGHPSLELPPQDLGGKNEMNTPISNFEMIYGDFHTEGDLCFALPEASCTPIQEEVGLLIEEQLSGPHDNLSDVQCLFYLEIVSELSDQGDWILKGDALFYHLKFGLCL